MTQFRKWWMAVMAAGTLSMTTANATERRFTYTYEPEVMPQGTAEFEQWVTLGTQRSDDVGQRNFNKWEMREEFEYGVTDHYTVELIMATESVSFRDPTTGTANSEFSFDGIAIENRYMVLNPAENAVGLTLYFEPRFSGTEAEIEEKIIIGQRCGDWKWALNLTQETEFNLDEHETEGELEVTFGIARQINKRWSLGIEFRNHNEIPQYEDWENTAFFVGPVINYSRDNWWATLTVLPQVWGKGTSGGPDVDGVSGFELEGHERVDVRLIFGIGF